MTPTALLAAGCPIIPWLPPFRGSRASSNPSPRMWEWAPIRSRRVSSFPSLLELVILTDIVLWMDRVIVRWVSECVWCNKVKVAGSGRCLDQKWDCFEIVGFGFSILVAQGARKKKEKQRKSIKEKEYLNVRKTFNFTFYHFQSFLLKPTRITTRPSSAMHGALGNASQLGSEWTASHLDDLVECLQKDIFRVFRPIRF